MNKLGILLGIGIIFAIVFGLARQEAMIAKAKDAVVESETTISSPNK